MKPIYSTPGVLLTLLFFHLQLNAQYPEKIDSLLSLLNSSTPDSIRIDLYISLHTEFAPHDTTKSLEYINRAILLSHKVDDKERFSRSNLELCHYYFEKSSLEKAKKVLFEVEKQLLYVKDPKIKSGFFIEWGLIEFNEGNYESAADNFFKAKAIYEILIDTSGIGKCYSNLGSIYWRMNDLDRALDYFQKSLIYKKSADKLGLSKALGNIGLIYRARNDYPKALDYYQQSLEISQKYGFKLDAAINLQNIGVVYEKQKDYPKALKYFIESNELSKTIDDKIGVLYTNHGIATLYGNLGAYQKAIPQLEEALTLAQKLNIKQEIKDIHGSFAELYENMGNYKLAIDYRKNYESWRDSLISENHLKQIKELEVKYETEKKDQQITLLAKEKEVQEKETLRQTTIKRASMGGLTLITLLAGLFIYTLHQRLKNQKIVASKNDEIKEANFKRQLSELERKALQAQINPHFIFNCMNSINQMILEGDNQQASKYLTKFSKLIRLILENAEDPEVSLKDELSMLEAYIQLESLRFSGEIQYQIKINKDIEPESTYLPSMVLQPFVENAIWHGLMHKKEIGNGLITISIKQQEDQLVCLIEDNGVGREKALELQQKTVWKSKSLGLKITEERLRLISQELQKQLIRITDLKDAVGHALGTRVEVSIPTS